MSLRGNLNLPRRNEKAEETVATRRTEITYTVANETFLRRNFEISPPLDRSPVRVRAIAISTKGATKARFYTVPDRGPFRLEWFREEGYRII